MRHVLGMLWWIIDMCVFLHCRNRK